MIDLKRVLCFLLVFIFIFTLFPLNVFSAGVGDISAEAAVLMVASSGEVLWQKNAYSRLPMASTTKIMTALLTIEQRTPERIIKITEDMVRVEGTSMGLLPDDSVSFYALICGMLLQSGNDAANVAAVSIAGSVDGFAVLMNKKAKQIGMKNTNFVTPSGLDDENHYSCAYDMALLGCTAVKNAEFLSICSKRNVSVSYGNPPYKRQMTNHNRLLSSYEGAIGIKTGFTKKSGRCLVSAAERNGVMLVAVTLNAPNDWSDHTKMLDYGFSLVKKQRLDDDLSSVKLKITGGESKTVGVKAFSKAEIDVYKEKSNIKRVVYLKQFEYAPISENTVIGRVMYYDGDTLVFETDLVTQQEVKMKTYEIKENKNEKITEKIKRFFRR